MLEQFLKWPKLIWASIYEKIAEKAKKANTSVKEYLGDESNIEHISSVVYEGIPFFFKFSLKADSFNEKFKKHFTAFRDKMYSYDDEINAKETFKERLDSIKDYNQWLGLKGAMSVEEIRKKVNNMKIQLEEKEKIFNERMNTPENSTKIFNSQDYPNGISPEEVLEKIEAMEVTNKTETKVEQSTRAKLLKDWAESQKILAERAASISNPEELSKMTCFTSDMSEEEIRDKFMNMVSESRAKVILKEKPVRTRKAKVAVEKTAKAVTAKAQRKKKTEDA